MGFRSHGPGKLMIRNFPPGFGVGVGPKVTGIELTARVVVRMLAMMKIEWRGGIFVRMIVLGFVETGGLAAP